MLEDDPDTKALESHLASIGRTRRLFRAVDDIVQKETEKAPGERVIDVADRVIIYIDDLDRCSEERPGRPGEEGRAPHRHRRPG